MFIYKMSMEGSQFFIISSYTLHGYQLDALLYYKMTCFFFLSLVSNNIVNKLRNGEDV